MNYDGLFILNIQGKDEGLKEIIDLIEKEIGAMDGKVAGVQKMDKRQFSYVAGPLDSGHYVNFIFQAEPPLITKLRTKFKLDPEVYRQNYMRLPEKKEKKERASKKVAKAK